MVTVSLFQATEEKIEMTALQNNNKQILCNLLPAHVAAHFIDNQNKSHMVMIYVDPLLHRLFSDHDIIFYF